MKTVTLADIPLLWRAESLASLSSHCVPTGFEALDQALGGGWPTPSLIDVLCDAHGIGELRLLLGLLKPKRTSETSCRQVVLWLAPPFELHAIALAQYGLDPHDHWVCAVSTPTDLQWAMTQALRSGACLAVIAWARKLEPTMLRTLKLAAMTGRGVGVLFRPTSETRVAAAATLRMALARKDTALEISILKMQGRRPRLVRLEPAEIDAPTSVASP